MAPEQAHEVSIEYRVVGRCREKRLKAVQDDPVSCLGERGLKAVQDDPGEEQNSKFSVLLECLSGLANMLGH